MTAVPGAAGIATSVTGGSRLMNEVYATTAPVDLRKMNRKKLLQMGINEDVVDLFIDNTVYTPRQQTDLVFALEDLKRVSNRQVFIKFAIGAANSDVSSFRQRMAQMYAVYHQKIGAVDRFVSLGRDSALRNLGVAKTKKDTVIFLAPLDYLVWTEQMATIFRALDREVNKLPNTGKEIWLAGNLSSLARKNIEAAGWKVFVDQEVELLGKLEGAKERISYR
jgi:hypothetical protein